MCKKNEAEFRTQGTEKGWKIIIKKPSGVIVETEIDLWRGPDDKGDRLTDALVSCGIEYEDYINSFIKEVLANQDKGSLTWAKDEYYVQNIIY